MKYAVLILTVLVVSASAAVAHDIAYGTKGMASQSTLSAACASSQTDAGKDLRAMLSGVELASVSIGVCSCSELESGWFCTTEAAGFLAHEHPEEVMEDMEEESMGEDEGQS
jgi:hypothetical protein